MNASLEDTYRAAIIGVLGVCAAETSTGPVV